MIDLLAMRVVQGAGAAFMATGGTALVALAFPNVAQRARAFGVMGVISGVAMALGPTLGGFLASWLGWRRIFLQTSPSAWPWPWRCHCWSPRRTTRESDGWIPSASPC